MRFLNRMIGTAALAGLLLLSSCGGGSDGARPNQLASPGVKVAEPAPADTQRTPLALAPVVEDTISGMRQASNVVVRDASAWSALWAEHSNGRSPAPAMPQVDFSSQMLVAVFAGQSDKGCRQVRIDTASAGDGKIVVRFEERDLVTFAICTEPASTPMSIAAIARSNAAVEFVQINPVALAFTDLDHGSRSRVTEPKNVVLRDAAAFAALWAEHSGQANLPPVDFTRHMVIGVFLGARPNGCHGTAIDSVVRADGKLTVSRTDTEPAGDTMCTLAMVYPAHLVVVARSDAPVEFKAQLKGLK